MMTQASRKIERLILVGDNQGVSTLLKHIDLHKVVGVVAARNRPQYHPGLRDIAFKVGAQFLIQPPQSDLCNLRLFEEQLEALSPDGLICHSYSLLMPESVINMVEGRAFNVHVSLLPLNRGPNPIQWAIINGHKRTGVTIHVMDMGMDTGPIVDQEVVEICDDDTWVTLLEKVSDVTEVLLQRTIPSLIDGSWTGRPQNDSDAVVNKRIPMEGFEVDLSLVDDESVYDLIRAQVSPLRGVVLKVNGGSFRINEYVDRNYILKLRGE